jgi:hypothetical protein
MPGRWAWRSRMRREFPAPYLERGNACVLAHPSSFYLGEAISTRGRRYYFWTIGEVYGATREETCGRIVTVVTPPSALKAAICLAVANRQAMSDEA